MTTPHILHWSSNWLLGARPHLQARVWLTDGRWMDEAVRGGRGRYPSPISNLISKYSPFIYLIFSKEPQTLQKCKKNEDRRAKFLVLEEKCSRNPERESHSRSSQQRSLAFRQSGWSSTAQYPSRS